ncbi:hypothetical protein CPAR01_05740 [Colletotrichum paranaense]|uniref:Uncharacterized protein n=1 Tax=Colletotrichum paranaense TaxID=1914294 RepID=A0ABQ9SS47_9PEZI|nr:uncharacterized protein CPAR01_05740 [Colletotrichum paranaense]KAK1542353.1 hypothetical protein CPAR01_05740 [Colletotrichum paranaense]
MKFAVLLIPISFILPSLSHPLEDRDAPQTVHLTFHGGPASYEMTIPADGQVYPTNNDISVNIIDAPDYNALSQCTFYTNGEKALVGGITPQGLQQVIIGPPQPVTGVSCLGICVPTYGMCYDLNGHIDRPIIGSPLDLVLMLNEHAAGTPKRHAAVAACTSLDVEFLSDIAALVHEKPGQKGIVSELPKSAPTETNGAKGRDHEAVSVDGPSEVSLIEYTAADILDLVSEHSTLGSRIKRKQK